MLKKLILTPIALVFLLVAVVVFRTITFASKQPQVDAVPQISVPDAVLEHLSQAIQVKTISYDDPERFTPEPFLALHALIDNTFPLVDSLLEKEYINNYSLLYKWPGKDPAAEPVVLMAHMDVVPIEDPAVWAEDPFGGKIDDEFVWGRGTLDDKLSVFGILEAAELLLGKNFQPQRTIYFAFGHDEEISGQQGAESIAKLLQERGIKAQFVLDEGMIIADGLVPGIEKPVALIGTSEKGYATLELTTHIEGGHSSMPAGKNSIATLAEAVEELYENPFPARISEPTRQFIEYLGPEMPFTNKMAFANMWLFEGVFIGIMEGQASGNALVHTTTAPTMFNSGVKENLVPADARAVVNFRLLPGESVDDVVAHVTRVIDNEQVKVKVLGWANEASPVSSVTSAGFNTLSKSLKQVFPDALIAPSLVIGATDSRYFTAVSPDVYRMQAVTLTSEDLPRIHGIDERVGRENYKQLIRFYVQLMKNVE